MDCVALTFALLLLPPTNAWAQTDDATAMSWFGELLS
jgi:hypothetical protein